MPIPNWLDWAQRLQAIAQSGMYYAEHFDQPFDLERYQQVSRIAAEIIAAAQVDSVAAFEQIEALYAAQAGHTTPKTDVRGVVFKDDKILLVQEKLDGLRWTLPGGWADVNESAAESVVREVWEESGYRVRAVKLLALFDRNKHPHPPFVFHAYKAFFRCALISDEQTIHPNNTESGETHWFSENEIDGLDLSVGRVTAAQIHRWFVHLRSAELPTDFD